MKVALRPSLQVTGAFSCCRNSPIFALPAFPGGDSGKWLMPAGISCLEVPLDFGTGRELLDRQREQGRHRWTDVPEELGLPGLYPGHLSFADKHVCEVSYFYWPSSDTCTHKPVIVDYSLPFGRKNILSYKKVITRKKWHVYFVLLGFVKCFLQATVGLQANDSIDDGVTYGPQGAVAYFTASKLPGGGRRQVISRNHLYYMIPSDFIFWWQMLFKKRGTGSFPVFLCYNRGRRWLSRLHRWWRLWWQHCKAELRSRPIARPHGRTCIPWGLYPFIKHLVVSCNTTIPSSASAWWISSHHRNKCWLVPVDDRAATPC